MFSKILSWGKMLREPESKTYQGWLKE